jgi:glutamine synthetase
MHVHQSLFHAGRNVMHDPDGYGQLSRDALHYVGGLCATVVR